MIVFDVAGTIPQNGLIRIDRGNLTIAGQTAPAPGIQVRGVWLAVWAPDVYISHVSFRHGYAGLASDCMTIGNSLSTPLVQRLVFDHCLVQWGNDECMSFSNYTQNATIANTIIAEGAEPGHQLNSLSPSATDNILYYGSLLHTCLYRNPRIIATKAACVNTLHTTARGRSAPRTSET